MIISSQRYIDEEVVNKKIAEGDFEVMLSPKFEIGGETYQVVLGGHHALQAAKQTGVEPAFWIANRSNHDAIWLLEKGLVEEFLLAVHMGDDYYDINNGGNVWQ